jgi:hypothetical protein
MPETTKVSAVHAGDRDDFFAMNLETDNWSTAADDAMWRDEQMLKVLHLKLKALVEAERFNRGPNGISVFTSDGAGGKGACSDDLFNH